MADIFVTRHVAVTTTGQTTFANDVSATAAALSAPSGHIRLIGVSISKSITTGKRVAARAAAILAYAACSDRCKTWLQ